MGKNKEYVYTKEDLQEADKMLKSGKYGLRAVARYTHISATTLAYRLLGRRDRMLKQEKKYRDKNSEKLKKKYKEYYKKNKEACLARSKRNKKK